MVTTETLRAYGANVDEGLGRCMGNEALYLRLVNVIFDDPSFAKLEEGIANKDYKQAFEAAHALKGVLGNLSLTPLYEKVAALTEDLRAQQDGDYAPQLLQVLEEKKRLDALRA